MQVNVTFRHLEPSDALKAFAREKIERVGRFLDSTSEASVILSLEKHLHHAEVLVHSGPFFLRGRDKSGDMYASIGLATDKIEKQLKRYKDRLRQHKPAGHHNIAAVKVHEQIVETDAEPTTEAAVVPTARVVRSQELTARRMTLDEAILQINLIEEPFLVFTNAATGHVAVLYRRDADGTYGVIDARPAV